MVHLEIDVTQSSFIHNVPPSNKLQIEKLQGGFASLNTYNKAMKLGKNLIKKVDAIAEKNKYFPSRSTIN